MTDHSELLERGNVTAYVDQRLFGGKIDSLASNVKRKQALADEFRYSVLYLLYEHGRMSRTRLATYTGRDSNDLQHHLRKLLDTKLIGRIPAPDDADGRQTYYRITTLGKQEIESDVEHVLGGTEHEVRHEQYVDPAFHDNLPDQLAPVRRRLLGDIDTVEARSRLRNWHSEVQQATGDAES